ncbi:MAG: UDP-N-acetylmuramoyl-L-alanyl-D-glutamate--2,6-diaminopimelate ligase [Candidatus Moranbacteria bacterium]|jgi:UDP-N-acetylmuramoyl-L-alanyl-D-glutamate--2,6-diaminopimelate ligase|nr:UDP-N-acetylmuramoyl-L-alanyl-D-glutamate--2,6-diaminopimelate ligase [Candidatus Moranbacteria bacterium]MBP9801333.1 UDP-N-acetylmuramoyl-L-alanyl-D-glutamate--2,6-diaminopimelate ligase [Candidatus Moranbacteria bacterium]
MLHACSRFVPQSLKNILYHFPLAVFAAVYFGFPARQLKVIGITGTNGKTTTTQFITRILQKAGKKVAMTSTINFEIGDRKWTNVSKFTTLSSWKLQKFLREAVRSGCEYAVLETSSHALDQYRVWGISYEIVVMTNVTHEHLDYHLTMKEYRRAKKRLFKNAQMAVVNLDMENPKEYLNAKSFTRSLSYSTKKRVADMYTEELVLDTLETSFLVQGRMFHIHLPGRYNVENALASLAVARLLEIDLGIAGQALDEIVGIPGRMEFISNVQGFHILIDYAVTPDSLEKLYTLVASMRLEGARIIAVFGSCGERDRSKRPIMGSLVSSVADIVILTNEDPYYEDPEQILDEIEGGITGKEKGKNYWRIPDRREAISQALKMARSGDWIVVTGKGAEESMAIGDLRLPWNERSVIEEELRNRVQS